MISSTLEIMELTLSPERPGREPRSRARWGCVRSRGFASSAPDSTEPRRTGRSELPSGSERRGQSRLGRSCIVHGAEGGVRPG